MAIAAPTANETRLPGSSPERVLLRSRKGVQLPSVDQRDRNRFSPGCNHGKGRPTQMPSVGAFSDLTTPPRLNVTFDEAKGRTSSRFKGWPVHTGGSQRSPVTALGSRAAFLRTAV